MKLPVSSNNYLRENDGIDHINIYSKGKTELGKILSNFAYTPFEYNGIKYNSIEGAIFYYRTGDERFINLYGTEAKKLGKSLKGERKETYEMLKDWCNAKLNQIPIIEEILIQNELPFSHYFVMWGKKIDRDLTCSIIWTEISNDIRKF